MPATIHKPKHPLRHTKIGTGTKSEGLRGKITDALRKSKGGMTVRDITKAIGKQPLHARALRGTIVDVLQQSNGGMSVGQIATAIKDPQYAKALKIRGRIAKLNDEIRAMNVEIPKVILPELHDPATGRIDA